MAWPGTGPPASSIRPPYICPPYQAFCATLDYIWLSHQWRVVGVAPTPTHNSLSEQGATSLPCASEPSDHVLIGAELEC